MHGHPQRLSLSASITAQAGSFPLLVTSCVDGGSCVTAKITKPPTGTFECVIVSGSAPGGCSFLVPEGDLLFDLALDATEGAKTSVTVSVSITDATNAKVFEGQKSAAVATTTPNGPECEPTCHQGKVTFTL